MSLVAWMAAAWSLLSVAVATGVADAWDASLVSLLSVPAGSPWSGLWEAATFLGDGPVRAAMAAVAALYLLHVGRRGDAFMMAGAAALAQALSTGLKLLFARPRPGGGLVETSAHAYPSGHALVTAAVLLTWALLAGEGRRAVWGLAVGLAFLVGWSRVALGVHYVSDVVSGWLVALLIMAAVAHLRSTSRRAPGADAPGA